MNYILILKRQSSDCDFFEVEKVECDDKEYKRYTAICDSYYYKIEIINKYESLHFGYVDYSTDEKTADIPHENILVKNGEVVGFLYDTAQTPNGFDGHNGQLVFLLDDAGKKKHVGGYASVGCNSSSEYCTLVSR